MVEGQFKLRWEDEQGNPQAKIFDSLQGALDQAGWLSVTGCTMQSLTNWRGDPHIGEEHLRWLADTKAKQNIEREWMNSNPNWGSW